MSQLKRYPAAQKEDLYKLTHQASLGSEHAVRDIASARDWLVRELSEMTENANEPVIDKISTSGKIVRVYLWPYVQAGGDPEILLRAFVKTANEFKGNVDELQNLWGIIERMAELNEIPYDPDELKAFFIEMGTQGYPAIHHSLRYERLYKPSYRVVAHDFLPVDYQR